MPEWESLSEDNKQKYYNKAMDILNGLYHCDRIWEAWQYGTMTQDDFILANEDDNIVEEIAKKLHDFIKQEINKIIF